MSLKTVSLVVLAALSMAGCGLAREQELKDGDIIFHTSRSAQSLAIQRATNSRYSHMGIIFFREGEPHVFEAVSTVRSTPLADWIRRGDDGHHVVKRLENATAGVTPGSRVDARPPA